MRSEFLGVVVFAVFGFAHAAAASVSNEVQKSLELWQPKAVQLNGTSLVVISKERRVTDQIYRAMVGGICMGVLSRPSSLNGVAEIRILNSAGRQGFVFEGGRSECDQINSMPIGDTKLHILGITHMHSN